MLSIALFLLCWMSRCWGSGRLCYGCKLFVELAPNDRWRSDRSKGFSSSFLFWVKCFQDQFRWSTLLRTRQIIAAKSNICEWKWDILLKPGCQIERHFGGHGDILVGLGRGWTNGAMTLSMMTVGIMTIGTVTHCITTLCMVAFPIVYLG